MKKPVKFQSTETVHQAFAAMRNARLKPTFAQHVRALASAAPTVLEMYFEEPSRCFEMSVAGAEVLRRLGHEARAVPAIMIGANKTRPYCSYSCGNGRAIYDFQIDRKKSGGLGGLPDRVPRERSGARTSSSCHAVIETPQCLIDLTFGQLGAPAPPTLVLWDYKWLEHRWDGDWLLAYSKDCPAFSRSHGPKYTKRIETSDITSTLMDGVQCCFGPVQVDTGAWV